MTIVRKKHVMLREDCCDEVRRKPPQLIHRARQTPTPALPTPAVPHRQQTNPRSAAATTALAPAFDRGTADSLPPAGSARPPQSPCRPPGSPGSARRRHRSASERLIVAYASITATSSGVVTTSTRSACCQSCRVQVVNPLPLSMTSTSASGPKSLQLIDQPFASPRRAIERSFRRPPPCQQRNPLRPVPQCIDRRARADEHVIQTLAPLNLDAEHLRRHPHVAPHPRAPSVGRHVPIPPPDSQPPSSHPRRPSRPSRQSSAATQPPPSSAATRRQPIVAVCQLDQT